MILKMFCILDSKVGAYAQPFYARSTPEGMRAFEDIFTSTDPRYEQSNYKKFPQDFHLYEIGEFDDETGVITPSVHVSLASGNQFLQ